MMRRILMVSGLLAATVSAGQAGVEVRSTGITVGQFNTNCAAMNGRSGDASGGRQCELPSGTKVTCAFSDAPQNDCLVETREKRKGGKKEQQEYLVVELKDLLVSSYREDDSDDGGSASSDGSLSEGQSADPGSSSGGKPDSADGGAAGGSPGVVDGGGPTGPAID